MCNKQCNIYIYILYIRKYIFKNIVNNTKYIKYKYKIYIQYNI